MAINAANSGLSVRLRTLSVVYGIYGLAWACAALVGPIGSSSSVITYVFLALSAYYLYRLSLPLTCADCEKYMGGQNFTVMAGALGTVCGTVALLNPPFLLWILLTTMFLCYFVGFLPYCRNCESVNLCVRVLPSKWRFLGYTWAITPPIVCITAGNGAPTLYHVPMILLLALTAVYGQKFG
ncbi:MAG: hypothetical protein Q3962_07935 [Corynebacterium sp.]|nr:hypothetical protein [Corynebacterium sp.]